MPIKRPKTLPPLGKKLHYLKEWRLFRKMTQRNLAEALQTDESVISLIESGKRSLSTESAHHFARILQTTPGILIDYDPNKLPAYFAEPSSGNMSERAHALAIGLAVLKIQR